MQNLNVTSLDGFDSEKVAAITDEFWQWSCAVYQNKEVAKICLAVQDTLDLNVNYLLLAIWTEIKTLEVSLDVWPLIHQESQQAEEAVGYIRNKRIGLKNTSPDAYQQALLIELKAEQQHQKQIIQTICKQNQLFANKAIQSNSLTNYLNYCAISDKDQDTVQQLAQLVKEISF